MGFDPLKEKGIPLENQFRSWSELNIKPYNKKEIHPYTRTRIILMNGIEVEGALFKHQFARHSDNMELKQQLAATRRIEQQQQKMVNWFSPGDESALETTIGYEQVAVDLTAWLARTEPDPLVKDALDFALIEDFDHLYRYANLLEETEGKQAQSITRDLTEIMPGRATELEHRHPFDSPIGHVNLQNADILTLLHILTIVSGEQQTMNFYMNVGNQATTAAGRSLYQEIGMIEEQHVTHYESLMDPHATWFERALLHEYNEAYMYYSCMQSEEDSRIKKFWEECLDQEITHLHMAAEMLKKHEDKDPRQFLPDEFPTLTVFQSNKNYVRDILATQTNLTKADLEYKPAEDLPMDHRYRRFQKIVNKDGAPSHKVIEQNISKHGRDYRLETEGEHPISKYRSRKTVEV